MLDLSSTINLLEETSVRNASNSAGEDEDTGPFRIRSHMISCNMDFVELDWVECDSTTSDTRSEKLSPVRSSCEEYAGCWVLDLSRSSRCFANEVRSRALLRNLTLNDSFHSSVDSQIAFVVHVRGTRTVRLDLSDRWYRWLTFHEARGHVHLSDKKINSNHKELSPEGRKEVVRFRRRGSLFPRIRLPPNRPGFIKINRKQARRRLHITRTTHQSLSRTRD
jgi:hypothetical protein